MTERAAQVLLSAAGLVAVAVPIWFGALNATRSRAASQSQNTSANALVYEVASIKSNKNDSGMVILRYRPDGFTATGIMLRALIREAYGVEDHQITGTSGWLNSEKYD